MSDAEHRRCVVPLFGATVEICTEMLATISQLLNVECAHPFLPTQFSTSHMRVINHENQKKPPDHLPRTSPPPPQTQQLSSAFAFNLRGNAKKFRTFIAFNKFARVVETFVCSDRTLTSGTRCRPPPVADSGVTAAKFNQGCRNGAT